jgi:hypothetical protein
MNKEEARQILAQELKFFNDIEYLELTHRVGENRAYEKKAPNGCSYQVEVSIVWDSEPQQVIRIIGSVDDGGLSAFIPLTESILRFPSK